MARGEQIVPIQILKIKVAAAMEFDYGLGIALWNCRHHDNLLRRENGLGEIIKKRTR